MNLGDWIDTLGALPAKAPVFFDNGRLPGMLVSWRGSYDELTLDSFQEGKPHTVGYLLKEALAADGGTFIGYKGGKFVMSRHTPVWADEWGEYTCFALIGALVSGERVVLQTADVSDYRQ